ncbi:hypothetical protein Tco_0994838 [Tanacetum coccineum]
MGTQTDKAPVYDSDGSAEVHHYENCYDNDIFNMFTQEEQYTELLEPIPEPHQVQQNDSNVISEVSSMEQSGGTLDQHPATIDKIHALSKLVTSNSIPTPQESKVVNNDKLEQALGQIRSLFSQPHVITKKDVNSNSNGLSSTGVDNTAKTRRPQPKSNTKNDKVPSVSKSCCSKNKEVEVEEHPRDLLLSKNKKHMSFECNNIKLAIRNDKSEVVYAMCKQCLITANHDVCVLNYVNDMSSHGKKPKEKVSNAKNQKKQKPKVMKPKKVGSNKRLASPKPSKCVCCVSHGCVALCSKHCEYGYIGRICASNFKSIIDTSYIASNLIGDLI